MAHHQTRNHPLRKQTAKRSDANHSRVGRSTVLLKPQVTIVLWKIRGQKFIDHLCVTLRYDCDGFSVLILKEVGSNNSSGPNSAPYGKFWVISRALMKFVRICSLPESKVLLVNCAMQIKMCLITRQKFVRQVWIFGQYFHKLTTKFSNVSLCPGYLKHGLLAICTGEDPGPYARCAVRFYQTCIRLEHDHMVGHTRCVFINYIWLNQLSNTTNLWWIDVYYIVINYMFRRLWPSSC